MDNQARPTLREAWRILRTHVRPYLPRLVLALVCVLLGSTAALLLPQALGRIIDGPIAAGDRGALLPATLLVLGLGLAEAGMIFARRMLVLNASTRIEYSLRMTMFGHLLDLSASFHDRWPSGQLLTRITQDLGQIRRWLAFGLIMLINDVLMILIGVALMMTTNVILGAVFLLGSLPLIFLVTRFERVYSRLSRRIQDQAGDVATVVEEAVKGIPVLKAFGRAPEALDRFGGEAKKLHDIEVERGLADADMERWLRLIPNAVIAFSLVLSVWFAALGWVSLGGVVAFFATATILRNPIAYLGILLSTTIEALSAVGRVGEVLDAPVTVTDPDHPATIPAKDTGARLEFCNVTFRFDDQGPDEEPLLKGVSLEVQPGERMALVGITGSGKSTLINLAARLYDVTSGAVLVDGVDVRDVTRHHLREQLAVAFEAPTLFSASVRDNVALGNPEATDADVARALDVTAADFVANLPEGSATVIGEEGMSLSGGQRQRLALARAVATRPRLMLLDDPLSALDVHTEARVTAALDEELRGTTALIVAHRPSTVALADRVALLHRGRVEAVGTHAELLATNERYRYVISSLEDQP